MIMGSPSSGKSSILQALLGEMEIVDNVNNDQSRMKRTKNIAYLAQETWTIGESIKNNILSGKKYDESNFYNALKTSQLLEDLKTMSFGTNTSMADIGSTVSGGQKRRICLARCIY